MIYIILYVYIMNNLPNIIFIADNNHFRIWPGKTYYDLLTYVKNNNNQYNISLFWTDTEESQIYNAINSMSPILIVFFITGCIKVECSKFMKVFQSKIPIACAMLDMFFPSVGLNDYKLPNALIHFGKNKYIENCYKHFFPTKCITSFNSRFINTNKFKNYNLPKTYDILLYGSRNYQYKFKKEPLEPIQNFIEKYETMHNVNITHDTDLYFYPLRHKLEEIIIKYQDKYNIHILPESSIYNSPIVNEDLSKLINQSHITIACSTIANVLMHKYLEIAASNSVILGDIPEDYRELFKDNIIEVDYFMSEDEILNIIDNALQNKNELKNMSEKLYQRIHNEHNLDCAVNNFNEVFQEISSNT